MSLTADTTFAPTALCDFVAAEAALIDEGRFDEWLALFAEDGRYWVPLLGARQADPLAHNSIACEDRLLLQLRIERLKNPRAHSQHPPSHCQHVLQCSRIEHIDAAAGTAALRTPFIYIEMRGEQQVLLTGVCHHALVRGAGGLLIRQKRIDLLQPERALAAIQLFI
ncbi:Biphenyl dioxygenase subunit beta [Variovorax sp. SRS16]|uniref:aromatic-ring-hydroxylating dioxygenase subunit beta n=1 Tax=Variovorax sp. SRS16 TaxID=282217 RepID=UPI001318844B|nr:aromatic-ring-hydroxylating dioxygenase subunit beta [Variovorax sp. SRS16]VTU18764.1 Biphenyl dioxygenase subunit beta [Variovorax sp. SRS16]